MALYRWTGESIVREQCVSNRSISACPFTAFLCVFGTIPGQRGAGLTCWRRIKAGPVPQSCTQRVSQPVSVSVSVSGNISMAPKKKEEPKPVAAPKPPEPEPPKVPDFNPAEVQVPTTHLYTPIAQMPNNSHILTVY